MAAAISVRLASEVAPGAVYAWAESDDGQRGLLLFSPPSAVFRECDGTGAVDLTGMHFDFDTQELTNRHPDRWRPFIQAAHGIWTRYRSSGGTTVPPIADRVFY